MTARDLSQDAFFVFARRYVFMTARNTSQDVFIVTGILQENKVKSLSEFLPKFSTEVWNALGRSPNSFWKESLPDPEELQNRVWLTIPCNQLPVHPETERRIKRPFDCSVPIIQTASVQQISP